MRNLSYSGSPVGTIGRVSNNAEYGLGPLVVNGARNLAVNLATTDKELNQRITDVVYRGLAALGLDANAPALSFPPAPEKFRLVPYQTSEDFAGNPVQLLIGVASVLVVLFTPGHAALPAAALRLWRSLPPPLSSSSCSGGNPGSRACSCRYSLSRLPSPPSCRSTARGRPLARMLATALAAVLGSVLLVYFAWPALWRNSIRPLVFIPGAGSIWVKSADEILFTVPPRSAAAVPGGRGLCSAAPGIHRSAW